MTIKEFLTDYYLPIGVGYELIGLQMSLILHKMKKKPSRAVMAACYDRQHIWYSDEYRGSTGIILLQTNYRQN